MKKKIRLFILAGLLLVGFAIKFASNSTISAEGSHELTAETAERFQIMDLGNNVYEVNLNGLVINYNLIPYTQANGLVAYHTRINTIQAP